MLDDRVVGGPGGMRWMAVHWPYWVSSKLVREHQVVSLVKRSAVTDGLDDGASEHWG